MKTRQRRDSESVLCYVIVGLMALMCLFPLVVAVSVSISEEADIVTNGFCILPRTFSLSTYEFMVANKGAMLFRAYGVTITVVILGTLYTMAINTCYAYALSQKRLFPAANVLAFFAWFTTVFGGGVLPWYILCTRYYGLKNNIWALFIPYGMNVFNMFILRNNFRGLPQELFEAARIDGASNWQIFTRIGVPLIKSAMVTISLFTILAYWNDFTLPLYLVTNTDYYTIQKYLYNMMSNITALMRGLGQVATHMVIPSNTAKMAMTVLTLLPVAMVFPFAQRYFVQGITVGAVKG